MVNKEPGVRMGAYGLHDKKRTMVYVIILGENWQNASGNDDGRGVECKGVDDEVVRCYSSCRRRI